MWWDYVIDYFASKCSDRYKKLYLEEKQKYEDLKRWAERLIASNTELLKEIKNK